MILIWYAIIFAYFYNPNTSNFTRHKFLDLFLCLFFRDNEIYVDIPNFCPAVYNSVRGIAISPEGNTPYNVWNKSEYLITVNPWYIDWYRDRLVYINRYPYAWFILDTNLCVTSQ